MNASSIRSAMVGRSRILVGWNCRLSFGAR
jgi:hypothetical protein